MYEDTRFDHSTCVLRIIATTARRRMNILKKRTEYKIREPLGMRKKNAHCTFHLNENEMAYYQHGLDGFDITSDGCACVFHLYGVVSCVILIHDTDTVRWHKDVVGLTQTATPADY